MKIHQPIGRLLLIHLAKTGGTSLRRLFKISPALSSFDCIHNGVFLRFQDGQLVERKTLNPSSLHHYDVAILMMRHPLARMSSCYRYFSAGGLNQRGKGVFPNDVVRQKFLQQKAPTLEECCQRLPEIAERIPHFRPVCHWLNQLPTPPADLLFCGRQERFQDDMQRFFQILRLDPINLEVEQYNSSKQTVDDQWDPQSIRLVEHFFAADYQRFGYLKTALPKPFLIQYWDQPSPPDDLLARMECWRKQNPHWHYQRYNRDSAATFIGDSFGPELQQAFLDIRMPAMQADVFRIAVLLANAGVWIDAATHCLKPLDSWLDRRQPLVLLRRHHQEHPHVWNGFIHAADPGHPLLAAAWEKMSALLLTRSGEKVYRDFGPGVIRDLLAAGAPLSGLQVLKEHELKGALQKGSSNEMLPTDQHWSKRQGIESLYFSGGCPSASHCRKEAS